MLPNYKLFFVDDYGIIFESFAQFDNETMVPGEMQEMTDRYNEMTKERGTGYTYFVGREDLVRTTA